MSPAALTTLISAYRDLGAYAIHATTVHYSDGDAICIDLTVRTRQELESLAERLGAPTPIAHHGLGLYSCESRMSLPGLMLTLQTRTVPDGSQT